jgi:hypothetical protein
MVHYQLIVDLATGKVVNLPVVRDDKADNFLNSAARRKNELRRHCKRAPVPLNEALDFMLECGISTERSHRSRVAHFLQFPGIHIVDKSAHGDRVRSAGRNPWMIQD